MIAPAKRTPAQRDKINWYFLENQAPDPIRRAWRELVDLRKQKENFEDSLPTVMVMQEMPTLRETHLPTSAVPTTVRAEKCAAGRSGCTARTARRRVQ